MGTGMMISADSWSWYRLRKALEIRAKVLRKEVLLWNLKERMSSSMGGS